MEFEDYGKHGAVCTPKTRCNMTEVNKNGLYLEYKSTSFVFGLWLDIDDLQEIIKWIKHYQETDHETQ